MHVTGIIAEYNPFHNGHRYQLEQIRRVYPGSTIIAVMSGSFVQRGEAALLDKWQRAELAIAGGCDLVLELPFAFACRSAQDFARGGVQLLARLGVIDTLAFGAECSSLTTLTAIATAIDSPAVQTQLHERISAGASYAQALTELTASEARIDASLLHTPNNILAIEYLRALTEYPAIEPLLIPRAGLATTIRTSPPLTPAPRPSANCCLKPLKHHMPQAANCSCLSSLPATVKPCKKPCQPQALPPSVSSTLLNCQISTACSYHCKPLCCARTTQHCKKSPASTKALKTACATACKQPEPTTKSWLPPRPNAIPKAASPARLSTCCSASRKHNWHPWTTPARSTRASSPAAHAAATCSNA